MCASSLGPTATGGMGPISTGVTRKEVEDLVFNTQNYIIQSSFQMPFELKGDVIATLDAHLLKIAKEAAQRNWGERASRPNMPKRGRSRRLPPTEASRLEILAAYNSVWVRVNEYEPDDGEVPRLGTTYQGGLRPQKQEVATLLSCSYYTLWRCLRDLGGQRGRAMAWPPIT